MPTRTPEELNSLYNARVNTGDLEGLLGLYEEVARFNSVQQGWVSGRAAIGRALGEFLALRPTFATHIRTVTETSGVALLSSDWHFILTTDAGETVQRWGTSVEVARRQADGGWLYLIDEPNFLDESSAEGHR